jgi:hypothetical protein
MGADPILASGDLAPDSHVIELGFRHAQARLDIPETFSIRQLCKGHTEKLVPARKALYFVILVVPLYTLAKLVRWHEIHQLCKNGSADIHKPSPSAQVLRKYGLTERIISNQ